MCGHVGEGVGVGVFPHIPHLVKRASCMKVHTKQGEEEEEEEEEEEGREVVSSPSVLRGGGGGGGGERVVLSPPTSIGQNPTDVGGEGEGGGGEVLLKRRLGSLKKGEEEGMSVHDVQ